MLKKIKSFFEDKPKEKKRVRKSFALGEEVITAEQGDQEITKEDIRRGKELFWGRYPHYPEMSTVYRKLFQKFEIDNSKRVKVYDSLCGSDMCNIASGSGPMVDYICDDDHAPLVLQQIKKLGLSDKFDRLVNYEKGNMYFAHVFSFYPKLDHEDAIDWQRLDDCTAPAGYVFLPKLVTNPKDLKKKPSQKLADNIAFYFYIELDHTMHWISVLNRKIEILQKETPPGLAAANQNVIKIFRDEVSKWASLLKQLKSNEISIVTSVYKHDDE
ncbi:MAG: hypothetical protein KDF58_06780 [Alphaproteobacteria bacterium]|nr:hypothetical protein [Alphaproteobacteria bacterium]HPF47113.1 hypothetical protein [Emcibacteraceae bacterium]HRW30385.1 hypothetical protein [Emcibacteraceae bacterium]